MKDKMPRLGVNLDHVATLRQLRGTPYPKLEEAVEAALRGGADQITVHLREDRRHIQDSDVKYLRKILRSIPLNLELATSDPILKLAVRIRPDWCCLVPEKRQELTTEGGLDLRKKRKISRAIGMLKKAKIQVSLFIEPTVNAVREAHELGADAVEFHTGRYCLAAQRGKHSTAKRELQRIQKAALHARQLRVLPHAGHGLDSENIRPVVELLDEHRQSLIEEYNIGHFLVCRSVQIGLEDAVREMASAIKAP